MRKIWIVAAGLAVTPLASANIRITEYMYSGNGPEYIEFTNTGASPIDMSGWSYDDVSGIPGSVSLSAFGVVAAGESVILTEGPAAQFAIDWALTGTKVIGDNVQNLGRADTINIYDSASALVDQLNYSDQTFPGTIRTQTVSGWAVVSGPGPFGDINSAWVLSSVGDLQGSYTNLNFDIGNPGRYVVPEPATLGLLGGLAAIGLRRRR